MVTTNASGAGVGATSSRIQDEGARRLVAAASRSLTEAGSKYAAIEKEKRVKNTVNTIIRNRSAMVTPS